MRAVNLFGFDSAWSAGKHGAICACRLEDGRCVAFDRPRVANFTSALAFIKDRHHPDDVTLVAIDQPTIVPNQTRMRPVERVVASVMSWSGGAIQPAYRDKVELFGESAPIWNFLSELRFDDDPESVPTASRGGFVMEVYPALALLSLDTRFATAGRLGPRYNPTRKTFSMPAWQAVLDAAMCEARRLALPQAADWCAAVDRDAKPNKASQDRLDALLCLLIAARWRAERDSCAMIGDTETGYIVAPMTSSIRARLEAKRGEVGIR